MLFLMEQIFRINRLLMIVEGCTICSFRSCVDDERSHFLEQKNSRKLEVLLKLEMNITGLWNYTELYVPLIRRLQALGIEYVVAPYEADAELGFLSRNNYVDFVITEDGDSLVYGCRCVLFKLDNGIGQEIDTSRLNECTEMNFCGWTHDMFTYMCVLSGCDYLPSLHGVGIRTAYSIVSKGKRPDHIFEMLRRKTEVPDLWMRQ